jgi:hypothetical protein
MLEALDFFPDFSYILTVETQDIGLQAPKGLFFQELPRRNGHPDKTSSSSKAAVLGLDTSGCPFYLDALTHDMSLKTIRFVGVLLILMIGIEVEPISKIIP